jgi:hypothetical protein
MVLMCIRKFSFSSFMRAVPVFHGILYTFVCVCKPISQVPTLAVVENMAFLEPPGGGPRMHPFGLPGGHLPSLCKALGVPFDADNGCARRELGLQLPISTILSTTNAHGKPLMLDYLDRQKEASTTTSSLSEAEEAEFKAAATPFEHLAEYVVRRCYEDQFAATTAPTVSSCFTILLHFNPCHMYPSSSRKFSCLLQGCPRSLVPFCNGSLVSCLLCLLITGVLGRQEATSRCAVVGKRRRDARSPLAAQCFAEQRPPQR